MRDVMGPNAARTAEYDLRNRQGTQTATASKFKEGDTASDARGNKIIFSGGEWRPR